MPATQHHELTEIEHQLGVLATKGLVDGVLGEVAGHHEEWIAGAFIRRRLTHHALELTHTRDALEGRFVRRVPCIDLVEQGAAVLATTRGAVRVDRAFTSRVARARLGERARVGEQLQTLSARGVDLFGVQRSSTEERAVTTKAARTTEAAVRAVAVAQAQLPPAPPPPPAPPAPPPPPLPGVSSTFKSYGPATKFGKPAPS